MFKMRTPFWHLEVSLIALHLAFLLVLFLLLPSEVAAQPALRIGIIGDQTASTNIDQSYQMLARGIGILAKENVSCVLHTGDLVESTVKTQEEYRARFEQARGLLDKLRKPWHLTPGDHDVNPPLYEPDSADRSREKWFHDLYRHHEPGLTDTLNYSFNLKGYHFIALNSQEYLHVDPRWGDVFLAKLSSQQYAWLERDLARHRNAKGIILFLHQPLWYNWGSWMPIHRLLRRYPVMTVIAGHFHYNQDEGELDGIHYFVMGATGGMVKTASRNAGNAQMIAVMVIRKRRVDFRLIPVDGLGALQINSRADMDRVQAISQAIDTLYTLGDHNVYCLKGNDLYNEQAKPSECWNSFSNRYRPTGLCYRKSGVIDAPKLSLTSIGNPIDQPVKLSIELQSDKLTLINPHFLTGGCQQVISDLECILTPATRVAWSNTSSVELNNRFAPLSPLWESGLAIVSGKFLSTDDSIRLKVRLSFHSSKGEQRVENLVTLSISTCPQ